MRHGCGGKGQTNYRDRDIAHYQVGLFHSKQILKHFITDPEQSHRPFSRWWSKNLDPGVR